MNKRIFSDYGIEIFERDNRFFIKYDAGGIVVQMREDEITAEEAEKAQRGEQDAYEVLLSCERRLNNSNGAI